jgi:hypothetical protein
MTSYICYARVSLANLERQLHSFNIYHTALHIFLRLKYSSRFLYSIFYLL